MPDLNHVNQLCAEFFQMAQAINIFDIGGTITSMMITPPPMTIIPPLGGAWTPPPPPVSIATSQMTYPPQMVESIKASIRSRQQEIINELAELGLTGFEKIEATNGSAGRSR